MYVMMPDVGVLGRKTGNLEQEEDVDDEASWGDDPADEG